MKGGQVSYQPGKTPSRTMTAVGMLCRQFIGMPPSDPLLIGGANYLLTMTPQWDSDGDVDFYYWYYGTMVMFQMGGDYWERWNDDMRDMLIEKQEKDPQNKYEGKKGSWNPVGKWCYSGGRPYATAVGALCLEVYYRYLPMYR